MQNQCIFFFDFLFLFSRFWLYATRALANSVVQLIMAQSITDHAKINKSRSSQNQPTKFNQLIEFIQSRARAFEAMQPSQSKSSSSMSSRLLSSSTISNQSSRSSAHSSRTAHHASSSQQSSTIQYPCDHCKNNHYIVNCPVFRDLSPTERHKVISKQRLCFNCFGTTTCHHANQQNCAKHVVPSITL